MCLTIGVQFIIGQSVFYLKENDTCPRISVGVTNGQERVYVRKSFSFLIVGVSLVCCTSFLTAAAVPFKNEPLFLIEQNGKYGYMDKNGQVKIKPRFDGADDFSEGRALVWQQQGDEFQYGYIDEQGKAIVPLSYDFAMDYREGLASVVTYLKDGIRNDFIDKTGKTVFSVGSHVSFGFSEGRAAILNNFGTGMGDTRVGFIDNKGKTIVQPQYEYTIADDSDFHEGLASVHKNGQYGFIDKNGAVKINFKYETALPFQENLAAVEDDNGKWGFIDKTGEYIIQPQFAEVNSFHDGLAPVMQEVNGDSLWGYIDKTGKLVIPVEYTDAEPFAEGLAAVEVEVGDSGKWGFIDGQGTLVVKPQFDYAEPFHNGLASVQINDGSDNYANASYRYGYINKQGKYVWKPSK